VGVYNTANGGNALAANTTGGGNTANGAGALLKNTIGINNTADGTNALYSNTVGNYNTANGFNALYNNTGSSNVAIGYQAGNNLTTGSNNIDIGNSGVAGDSGMIRIGSNTQSQTYIAGISGVTVTGGAAVYINGNGQLGIQPSSQRFKKDIQSLDSTSQNILSLRPVTFRYKQADEKGGYPVQYGLIAEEVAKVFPDLVQYDANGKPLAVYYHLLIPLLLGELQHEHADNLKQQAFNAQQQAVLVSLQEQNEQFKSELLAYRRQAAIQAEQMLSFETKFNSLQRLVKTDGNRVVPETVVYYRSGE
jgi:hypothetical protein